MKILIDMNLSPKWVEVFEQQGWQAFHWSSGGDVQATDKFIMNWAKSNGYIVFTHNLDFGALLAATQTLGPSVIQIRTQDIMPQSLGNKIVRLVKQFETMLDSGVLISVDEARNRVKMLPLH